MTTKKEPTFGDDLVEAMQEVAAFKRGEIALSVREVNSMPPERVKAIRVATARTMKEFEGMFLVPARTLEGWEQGRRKPDITARILLTVIERDPAAVARALKPSAITREQVIKAQRRKPPAAAPVEEPQSGRVTITYPGAKPRRRLKIVGAV